MSEISEEEWTKSLNKVHKNVVVHYTQHVWTLEEADDFLAGKGGKKEYIKVVFKSMEHAIEFVCRSPTFRPLAKNFYINGFKVHWNKKQQRFWFGFL